MIPQEGVTMRNWVIAFLSLASAGFAGVTFNKDVLPVLQNRCQECHRPGEAAPMSLLTYKEARPWAAAIRQAVLSRKMPPWNADPAHGKFLNERRLTPVEMETLVKWAETGAAEGNAKDAPPPREFTTGWTIGKPDAIIDMGADYKVPATGTIEYTYFLAPTGFKEDKWVEKIEVRPSARRVVHHIVLYARAPGSKVFDGARPGLAFVPPKDPDEPHKPDIGEGHFYGLTEGGHMEMVGVYVPGGDAYVTRPGQARLIKAGSDLVFQMHYTAKGKEEVDRSRVGIVFAKEPPKERVINTFILNSEMHIPPEEGNHRVDASVKTFEDVKVQSFFPHMHVRGKAMEYRVIYPTGETQILCSVPRYDFNWQMTYQLAEPLLLPKGTRIIVSAWYDNSPNNPANPNPKADVYWGDQTWEEMLAGFMDFVVPVSMNPARIAGPPKPRAAEVAQVR
jgi:Copper type II ascorbate-dependent monooxygenase, C-terminal domain